MVQTTLVAGSRDAVNHPAASRRLDEDLAFQHRLLPGVSRTFALTIPQLPPGLREAVANAYLLCRLADTIEDDPALEWPCKARLLDEFNGLIAGASGLEAFARELANALSPQTSQNERALIHGIARVLRVTRSLAAEQQAALRQCLKIMCSGMRRFQRSRDIRGLRDQSEVDRYCYFVAGVVGQMLTELFCHHSRAVSRRREPLMRLATSFGQALQMTNILKDFWEDRTAGCCWLPRDLFSALGIDLATVPEARSSAAFRVALGQLIGIAHAHLRNAMAYTTLIPARETGIRRFCLLAIGLAVLTLKRIHVNPHFTAGEQVKVSRRQVRVVVVSGGVLARNDRALWGLFDLIARDLPLAVLAQNGGAAAGTWQRPCSRIHRSLQVGTS